MKGLLSRILFLLPMILLVSCGTAASAIYYQGFAPSDASEGVALLSPVSCIYYLDNKGNESYDDSLSISSELMMTDLIARQGLPITATLPLDSLQKEESVAFMRYASSNKPVALLEAPIPSVLDSLLEANNQRYGLLLYTEGFTRDHKQYVTELITAATFGVLLAIVTMGAVYTYSDSREYAAGVSVAILDSDYDRVVFYNSIPVREANPMSEKHMGKFMTSLFKDLNK